MLSPRQIMARGFLAGVVAAVIAAGAFFAYVTWYTGTGRILPGVAVGATPVGGLRPEEAHARLAGLMPAAAQPQPQPQTRRQAAAQVAGQAATRVRSGQRVWVLPHQEVGPQPDIDGAVRQAAAIGRRGSLWQRSGIFVTGLVHGHRVPLVLYLREQVLSDRLEAIAREVNRPPEDARYDPERDAFTQERLGQVVDLTASTQVIRRAMLAGRPEADLVVRALPPAVRKADLTELRQYEVGRFATPILSAELGRVENISIAIKKIAGTVIKPGGIFSFNDIVGPRDPEHGWAQAYELYQGEYVLGYGGGICQVTSTLYNTVLLAGLEVRERYHHDRPLQYVPPGRDATVAWQLLDFRFRNNGDVPLMLSARLLPGSPQQIEVSLH
ncbi:MAG: hypothetical protein JWN15_3999, partial [Firmicutes bacterium]|nr:hypothetical protein [Bacillota bacterium]